MEDWSTGGVCLDCPENSHTTTVGSTNSQQCICDDGYAGPNGGPCQGKHNNLAINYVLAEYLLSSFTTISFIFEEVLCTLPNVPVHGSRGTCELNVGQTCAFSCNSGVC